MRGFILSDINSPPDEVSVLSFLLEGNAINYYHSLTKQVRADWFEHMPVLGQRFHRTYHELVYLSRMVTLRESRFAPHADYVKEFWTCVIESRVNNSYIQMGYLVNSPFVDGLLNDALRRQYIVEVRLKRRSRTLLCLDMLVEYCRRLHRKWLSAQGSSKWLQIDGGYQGCCCSETSIYDGSANFDFNNCSFKLHANATHQPHANSKCSSNAFDRARADEPGYSPQGSRRAACIHWRESK